DVLVNGAGIAGDVGNVWELPVEELDRVYRTNLRGVFLFYHVVIPHMMERDYGRVVNIASIAGKEGNPRMVPYSATKAAVIGLTKSVAKDFVGRGIRCNAICPATVDSPSLRARIDAFDDPEAARGMFQGLRSPAGEEMILEKNVFVERVLPGSVLRELSEEEMEVYRRPFKNPGEDRRPTLTWPRQIPIEGEPPEVVELVQSYADWLSQCDVPKLFINAEPGAILIGKQRDFCRSWPNQKEVTVAGNHFLQEDSPDEIGQAIAQWRQQID
ncbi:MAG: SDR family NAD(P)-dependent oxidoreductase, partial [Proteobacteria bacterium]|nr:SDR family NAD(P)-dependent oxidoreductase [Pseudomonadota bacterium]